MDPKPTSPIGLPGALIISAAIVAIAIIYTHKPTVITQQVPTTTQAAAVGMADVNGSDHILGNPDAPIKIVEYSDTSCPYCKVFYPIMQQVMNTYGPTGKVAWIYRSFPLDKPDADGNVLHPNSGHEAQALECAASIGGNDAFWKFTNRLYDITPSVTGTSPNGLDQKQLPVIAKYAGLDPVSFNDCLSSGQFKDKVEKEYLDGINAGVSGTPYSVLITTSGTRIPLAGAETYETMKTAIDALLNAPTQ